MIIPKTKTVKLYKETNYVMDSNCDYFDNYRLVYKENPSNEKVQDLHAAQYGNESYVDKYSFDREIEIPETLTTEQEINTFIDYRDSLYSCFQNYNDYFELVEKYENNRFRSAKSKETCAKAIQSLLDGTPDQNAIDYSTGRMFKGRR